MNTFEQTIHKVLEYLLGPVTRIAVRYSLRMQTLQELIKSSLMDAALEALRRDGFEPNVSRLALMTGLQRRDVVRLMEEKKAGKIPTNASLIARILSQWTHHKKFTKNGKPRTLSFEGTGNEFAELVTSVSKEVNPSSVLFELERVGCVSKAEAGVLPKSACYEIVGENRFDEGYELLSKDCNDLMNAVENNLFQSPVVPNLHLRTEFDNITEECLPKIREWLLDKGTSFQEETRIFLSKFDKDANPRLHSKKGGNRVVLGTFSYVEEPSSGKSKEKNSRNSK